MLCFCSETIHDLFASQLCMSFRREQSFSVRFLDQSSPINLSFINLFKETYTIFALKIIFYLTRWSFETLYILKRPGRLNRPDQNFCVKYLWNKESFCHPNPPPPPRESRDMVTNLCRPFGRHVFDYFAAKLHLRELKMRKFIIIRIIRIFHTKIYHNLKKFSKMRTKDINSCWLFSIKKQQIYNF